MMRFFPVLAACAVGLVGCSMMPTVDGSPSIAMAKSGPKSVGTHPGGIGTAGYDGTLKPKPGDQLAAFAMGCFWGSEETYRQVKGVVATAVGFSGGTTANPSYEQVCAGATHHAETVLVEFDPKKVTYAQLLEVFWASHDPSEFNRQGPDEGEQYRSVIFYRTPEQKAQALATEQKEQATMKEKIVTQIIPAAPFYLAEDYHQQYDEKSGGRTCPPPRRATHGVTLSGG